jgi:hypothetical protein
MLKEEPETAKSLADRIIKNTYRTLMTRGQKGCYIYCVDGETNEYFKRFVEYDADDGDACVSWSEAAEPSRRDDD